MHYHKFRKLLEFRFRDKFENYMINHMMQSQIGFVRNCGVHVNILIKRFLTRFNSIGRLKSKFKPKALLFVDFKSAHNNVTKNIKLLNREFNIEDIFTYADDMVIWVYW